MSLTDEGVAKVRAAYRGCYEKTRFTDKRIVRKKAKKFGIYFYLCPRCNGYHLTSISAERWKKMQERKAKEDPQNKTTQGDSNDR